MCDYSAHFHDSEMGKYFEVQSAQLKLLPLEFGNSVATDRLQSLYL
jgi:hypothetical protein